MKQKPLTQPDIHAPFSGLPAWQAVLFLIVFMQSACVQNSTEADMDDVLNPTREVSFGADLASSVSTRAGHVGSIPTDGLEDPDIPFGVFACSTGASGWDTWKDGGATATMNFMYNQQVTWDGSSAWTYSPIKYWPNDNRPADDQGAMGSQEHSYLSFFAYAPYAEVTPSTGGIASGSTTEGITYITPNDTPAKEAYLTYHTTADMAPDNNTDLLWAAQTNLFKTKDSGEGYVSGQVPFHFIHALSKFTITVQGLFDHIDNSDTSPQYPADVDDHTKILIERVDFCSSPIFCQGKMYLAPSSATSTVPHWETTSTDKTDISIDGITISADLADAYKEAGADKTFHGDFLGSVGDDVEAAQTAFVEGLPKGVTHTEQSLFADPDFHYLVVPNKEYITANPADLMQVRMVYYVITYDPNLSLNTPKYYSIVKNDITATFSSAFAFEPSKTYTLRLMPGVTSVKFEVTSVDEWETPVTLTPVVIDWYEQTFGEYDIDYDAEP